MNGYFQRHLVATSASQAVQFHGKSRQRNMKSRGAETAALHTSALTIQLRYLDSILRGKQTWELRTWACKARSLIHLMASKMQIV